MPFCPWTTLPSFSLDWRSYLELTTLCSPNCPTVRVYMHHTVISTVWCLITIAITLMILWPLLVYLSDGAEPSFLKVVSLVHRSTVTNGTCLLLIIFRSLAMQSGEETIPHKKATAAAADDSAMSLLQGEEKNHILTVEHDSEKAKFDINMVGQTSQAPPPGHETNDTTGSSDSRVALANNRAIVLILTFLQNLAKNGMTN